MSQNPYLPPVAKVADIAEPSSSESVSTTVNGLYSSSQIFAASFIGSPIAAAWFAASNLRKLHQPANAQKIIVWGVVATIVVMAIAFVLPDRIPNSTFPLLYSIGIRLVARAVFDPVVGKQKAAGAILGSWWSVVGVSLLWMILVLAILFGAAIVLQKFGVTLF